MRQEVAHRSGDPETAALLCTPMDPHPKPFPADPQPWWTSATLGCWEVLARSGAILRGPSWRAGSLTPATLR